ncbi:MAG: signal peptidase II [Chloroflexi bacterium RBG_16_64_43]|nr:MAG: signal peptidase II [Chloroflexi bacterium RBG_16_64_43]
MLIRTYAILATIASAIVALDQYTKFLVRTRLALGEVWMPIDWLAPYARIVHWTNTGAAFGLFQNGNMVFTVLAIIVSAAIIYYYRDVGRASWLIRLALGLQLGGALGNLIDRLTRGTVTDFLSVGTFPVFNVADSGISVGVALLLADMLIEQRRRPAPAEENPAPHSP